MSFDEDQLGVSLRGYAAEIGEMHPRPSAAAIWLRAERRRRRLAVERAERPLRMMQVLGLISALFAVTWMLYQTGFPGQLAAMRATVLELAVGSVVLIFGGCWTMLLASRTLFSQTTWK